MNEAFRVEEKKKNRKLWERFYKVSFDLYRKGIRRKAWGWIGLIWYTVILLLNFGMDMGEDIFTFWGFTRNFLLVFIWFLAAFRRFRNRFFCA